MDPDTQLPAQSIDLACRQRSRVPSDGIEARARAQRVAVLHLPKLADGLLQITAQCGTKIGKPVKLPRLGLTAAAFDRSKVVAIDGRRAGRDGASRPLGAIALISGHTIFWCDIR
jgi:hypothetical protein